MLIHTTLVASNINECDCERIYISMPHILLYKYNLLSFILNKNKYNQFKTIGIASAGTSNENLAVYLVSDENSSYDKLGVSGRLAQ